MTGHRPSLAVVGATGAIGGVMLRILSQHADVWGEVRLVASPRSAGRRLVVRGEEGEVLALSEDVFDGIDVALFLVPDAVSAHWVPIAAAKGAVVVDDSAAFRLDDDVPLVVPEINPHAARLRPRGIVASPNCTTLSLIVAVGALHAEFGLRELIVSSYQAVSGAGRDGVAALREQLALVAGTELGTQPGDVRRALGATMDGSGGQGPGGVNSVRDPGGVHAPGDVRGLHGAGGADGRGGAGGTGGARNPFAAPVALNVVPWAGTDAGDGWSTEEISLREECRKVLGMPDLKATATCVYVPVIATHSMSVHARFENEVAVDKAHEILATAPGVVLFDSPASGDFPTPSDVVGTDPTWVGRVRRSMDDPHALEMFLCGDNLRKGAALNVAQIAESIAAEFPRR
ncbi:aspartate-semialdehyde dehydrogenase [Streptomyces californicus]|uniref:Aspartate-semialdehyde dehydrogenase n=1 Tax=Streptomyces californicus TaxID=67351 RepID=A0ABD7D561_9ACTN|nr:MULTISPECIES: Asd/ArgC dimerization domain-containing protein [Streptomyces]QRV28530.1 aspartate-semialdehyde dehydrogenase [Streptomyces californicus]QRV35791.1 aspartate-semialdehyde dehydrogenase [Streptomyces californicus]QRV41929.1 aspartate-semialdehyde dehydrogenase [Streptomyces californicus]QRV48697.1 aspartate-semialdehyde dehydrogenase [Streptomyces californicus]